MIPPIFPVCAASPAVTALLGTLPTRLYPFGLVDGKPPPRPYVVWQHISGLPENFINQRPDMDLFTLQVDVYADTPDQALATARALRDAIETHAHITRWGGQGTDPVTKFKTYSFDVDWYVPR